MTKIAIVGTGLIGAGLAEAAAKRGDRVVVWNRTACKAEALRVHGVTVADTPAAAVAGVSRVHIALSADEAVDAVLEAMGDAMGDAVVLDHTTTSVAGTRARADRLAAQGVAFLHCPVFMSPQSCREASGLILVAGAQDLYARIAAPLAAMTGKVWYVGERPDLAAANKLFGNAMLVTIAAGVSDVLSMAAEVGVSPDDAMHLFERFDPSGTLRGRGLKMSRGDYRASFEMTMARKDVRLMVEAAGERPLAVLPGIASRLDDLIEAGHGGRDMGALSIDAVPSSQDE
jgi:3-hydroxyisobutyrate dehydrogenase-like beta-hydroxyacid dehydrogenase